MALSLTLSAVSAEYAPAAGENATGGDPPANTDAEPAGGNNESAGSTNVSVVMTADLETVIEPLYEDEYNIVWGIGVVNKGPYTAEDVVVSVDESDNLYLYGHYAYNGTFNNETLKWTVGDLASGDYVILLLYTLKIDVGPYYVEAFAKSSRYDPNLTDNYAIAYVYDASGGGLQCQCSQRACSGR